MAPRLLLAALLGLCGLLPALAAEPVRVTFPSADGRTTLVGYLFAPDAPAGRRHPAVVMMHGRAGAYSSRADGVYNASTLSQRHRAWGELLAEHGFVALLVDGFGPRGYPGGFPRHSYDDRPEAVSEVAVRPLDAAGGLAYLRARPDVAADRIGLMGWSNGGSATLATLAEGAVPAARDFRIGVALYPACGLRGLFATRAYRPVAPVRVFHGTADEEVSPERCARLVAAGRAAGGDVAIRIYPGATHSFDDPGERRQSIPANAEATDDATRRILDLFDRYLRTPGPQSGRP
ncbi:dienelactone hydrolase family protein [Methylobacterium sp. JK268]